MMHLTLILCDTLIIATRNAENKWVGTCSDNHSGKCESFEWTDAQLTAVTTLAMGGEEPDLWLPGQHDALSAIAEPLFANWQKEVRPIP